MDIITHFESHKSPASPRWAERAYMASAYGRNNYYRGREQEQPRIVQLLPIPPGYKVYAFYRELDDGKEFKEQVFVMGLLSDGDVQFLVPDADGIFDCPADTSNFLRYEYESS